MNILLLIESDTNTSLEIQRLVSYIPVFSRLIIRRQFLITDWLLFPIVIDLRTTNYTKTYGYSRFFRNRVFRLNPELSPFGAWVLCDIGFSIFSTTVFSQEKIIHESKSRLNQIQKELAGKSGGSPVFIFGNGPSLQLFDLSKTKNSVTIASNAFIKNSAAISACELNFIVASDAAVYFGPSTLAKLFLNDLSERLSSNNHLFFVYPLNFHQILHFNIPASLHSQLIPVPRYNNKSLTALRDHFELTDIGNTLNTILLPLSLLFSKTIILVGFDGIGSPAVKGSVTANYQWSYSDAFSYGTYSKSTRLFEPGFTNEHKKMIDNGTYTDIYFGNDFENNLAHLEDQGYQIFSVNRSTVPSIEKRFNPILAENYLAH